MSIDYKPWGNIDWILNRLPNLCEWDYIGCISTEERSLSAWQWLKQQKKLHNSKMWKINAPKNVTSPYTEIAAKEYKKQIEKFVASGGHEYVEFDLFESDATASQQLDALLDITNGNMIIDITSMPKRWFFPLIRDCLSDNRVSNLLVLYSMAKFYSKIQGEDSMSWRYLPSFGELSEREKVEKYFVISAGYQPLSLPDWISNYENPKVHVLFPFPASVNGYTRVWDFIRTIESDGTQISKDCIKYVSGFDLPEIYKCISEIIKLDNKREPIFMPYGPKPTSLAFAIIASQMCFPIGYTQPMYYNPYYSRGIEMYNEETPKTTSYLLKAEGNQLYVPPPINF